MIVENLKQNVRQYKGDNPLHLRNLLKEQLQFYVLNFIYSSKWGENLVLKGGSCLRMFFSLPRVSEDLDLDVLDPKSFFLEEFLTDLKKYFSETLQYKNLKIKISGKKNIVYLKFPILDKLELAKAREETKTLFLRIDLSPALGTRYKTELSVKSTYDFSFIVKRYSLPDLFAGKIAAVLQRTTKEGKKIKPRVKGRDYFDLVWFLENKTPPNFVYLQELISIKDKEELKKLLGQKIKELDLKVLQEDIQPLFGDKNFVKNFVANYQKITSGLVVRF